MSLYDICDIGLSCGLTTIQEAILNAELHWDVFTTIDDYHDYFKKLYEELNEIDPDWDKKDILIKDIFPDIDS